VLVTDVVMPGVHGLELAARIRAQRPGIGVVFMSGYAEGALDGTAGNGGEHRVSGEFLPKPFSAKVLSRAVGRAVVASRQAR
jgi:two-component system cell cycle sensor histidine kinase/response regulator CckA